MSAGNAPPQLPRGITVHVYTSADLRQQAFLPGLQALINDAYRHIHATSKPTIIPETHVRVKVPTQICDELGPDGLMLVAFGDESSEKITQSSEAATPWDQGEQPLGAPVACAGVKALQENGRKIVAERFHAGNDAASLDSTSAGAGASGSNSGTQTPTAPAAASDMGEPAGPVPASAKFGQARGPITQWEVCMICSRPQSRFAGVGLPSTLLRMLENEVVRSLVSMPSASALTPSASVVPNIAPHAPGAEGGERSQAGEGIETVVPTAKEASGREAILVICIVQELTGRWWAKKDYRFFYDEIRPPGSWESTTEFVLRWGAKVVTT